MTWQVTIRRAAQADLRASHRWYEQKRSGLGDEFLFAIADAMASLEERPDRHALYYRDFRRLLTKRFPFKIFYRLDGQRVIVYRVLHAARDHTNELGKR